MPGSRLVWASYRGHEVMTVCPRYQAYIDAYDSGYVVPVETHDGEVSRLFLSRSEDVEHIFVDHPALHTIRPPNGCPQDRSDQERFYPYWWGSHVDFEVCYSILCQAALAAPTILWKAELDASLNSASFQGAVRSLQIMLLPRGNSTLITLSGFVLF